MDEGRKKKKDPVLLIKKRLESLESMKKACFVSASLLGDSKRDRGIENRSWT